MSAADRLKTIITSVNLEMVVAEVSGKDVFILRCLLVNLCIVVCVEQNAFVRYIDQTSTAKTIIYNSKTAIFWNFLLLFYSLLNHYQISSIS